MCLSHFTKHSCRISASIQTNGNRKRNNVEILEQCALIVAGVRLRMRAERKEGGRGYFSCDSYPAVKSKTLHSGISEPNTLADRRCEVENSGMKFSVLKR